MKAKHMKNVCFTSLILIVALVFSSCKGKKEVQAAAPLEVPVVKVMQQDIALESEYTGQTYGESDVEIRTRVEGWVLSMNFKEGSKVKKGQLLYTIDPLPYKNKVDQADAALAASVFHFQEIEIQTLKKELKNNTIPIRL